MIGCTVPRYSPGTLLGTDILICNSLAVGFYPGHNCDFTRDVGPTAAAAVNIVAGITREVTYHTSFGVIVEIHVTYNCAVMGVAAAVSSVFIVKRITGNKPAEVQDFSLGKYPVLYLDIIHPAVETPAVIARMTSSTNYKRFGMDIK